VLYFARLGLQMAEAALKPKVDLFGESVISLRVWPADLDLNLHMNNARFLSAMELGRWDLAIRQGWAKVFLKRRWKGLVGAATIRFRRSLKPFEPYRLHSRIAGWDEKWCFMEHRLLRSSGEVSAVGGVKALFRGPDGNVPSQEVLEVMGFDGAPPPLPEWMAQWSAAERQMA
jgi:acyl-CoA thioesterase FadM